jgi:hypothetical protein
VLASSSKNRTCRKNSCINIYFMYILLKCCMFTLKKEIAMHGMLCKVVCAGSAIGATYLGLQALGYDVLSMIGLDAYAKVIMLLFGVCGVLSLVMMFMRCKSGTC